ncbi:MAG: S24 family peptidase [Proteobacteria bacterium]|jgi:SOS-response transcriptional repressor LexA|nr:S24 family peptidase [Pseudomonadota bacterium]
MSELKSQMIPDEEASGCASAEPFALQVIDDSMEPEFKKDCLIIIDPEGLATDGAYVLATVENGYIFRQLRVEAGKYFIQPLNDAYMHEKREVAITDIKGVIIQQAAPNGRRKDRKKYEYRVKSEVSGGCGSCGSA